jgi:hypothetical protein
VIRTAKRWGESPDDVAADLVQETYLRLCDGRCHQLYNFALNHPEVVDGYVTRRSKSWRALARLTLVVLGCRVGRHLTESERHSECCPDCCQKVRIQKDMQSTFKEQRAELDNGLSRDCPAPVDWNAIIWASTSP